MKKLSNKFIFILVILFVSILPVSAKEMNLEQLGKEIVKVDEGARFAYLIGEHAFTSNGPFDTQDIMLAARTINVNGSTEKNDVFDKMAIHRIQRTYNDDGDPIGWTVKNNLVGKTVINDQSTFNIKYINYTFVKEDSKFTIENLEKVKDEKYKNALNTTFSYNTDSDLGDLKLENGKFSGTVNLKTDINGFAEGAKTNYYLPFVITVPDAKDETTIKIEGKDETTATYQNFDKKDNGEKGIVVLWAIDPENTNKKITITVDIDGDNEKDIYAPMTQTIDWSDVVFQKQTVADISVEENTVPTVDKDKLNEWGYKFPNEIELSTDNTTHNQGDLKLDKGVLTGTIKEQKLKGGFNEAELDSYFYTFTIKPEFVTDDIKVTIKNGEVKQKEYTYDDFTKDGDEYVLTILQHIPLTEKTGGNKKITITIDSDGNGKNYLLSEEYSIDYSKVDFVDLHTVTYNDNNGNKTSSEDIYDGEKLSEPTTPTQNKNAEYDYNYSTFDHWNKQAGDAAEANSDTKYEFENNKSKTPITEDLTLYPIWEIDVEKYIDAALEKVNANENVDGKFKIEKGEEDKSLNVEILDRNTKIDNISETGIADIIAHALASGEIKDISVELNDSSKTFNADSHKDEQTLKGEVAEGLKTFFDKVVQDTSNKDLNDLYTKWSEDEYGLELNITPVDTVAKIKDQAEKSSVSYYVSIEEELMISFDAGVLENPETEYVKKNEGLTKLPEPVIPENEISYRTFDGWYNEDQKVETLSNVTEDKTLTAHYKLNVEKFIEDVVKDLDSETTTYSDDFSGKFDLTQSGNNIAINVDGVNVPLTDLADSSIPGTIAYILKKGEIKDITLTVDGQNKKFDKDYKANNGKEYNGSASRDEGLLGSDGIALKKEIIEGAKEAFDTVLESHENDITLDQLEFKNKSFSIKIGDVDDTIKLVNDSKDDITKKDTDKTYTFNFDSDFVVVDQDDNLGEQDIVDAVSNSKNYSEIYIDGNYNSSSEIDIVVNHDVTIKPISPAEGNPTTTITASGSDVKYALDISGSKKVTISDLKITGGSKAELRCEDGTEVKVDNIDVSGLTKPAQTQDEEMHAAIIVKGKLEANNIINSTESYALPTIAMVTSYSYSQPNTDKEVAPEGSKENLSVNGSVTTTNMTKIEKYNIVKVDDDKNIDSIVERYYGQFYYNDKNHSKFYIMAIMDSYKDAYPYDFIKIYYYDDEINITKLGYTPDLVGGEEGNFEFKKLVLSDDENTTIEDNKKAQDVLKEGTTTKVFARYEPKPSARVVYQSVDGLTTTDNNLSEIIKTQSDDDKFYIPISLTSEKFQDNISTVKVTNPNGKIENFVYSSSETNGLKKISEPNTMNLQLEAIKSSNITTKNGKVYTIKLDIDGEGETYSEETYKIDYSNVKTLEEVINNAANNTINANSLTVTRNNHIKNNDEKFTYQYDKEAKLTYYKSTDNSIEEYTFQRKYANPDHVGDASLNLIKNPDYQCSGETCKPKLNDWVLENIIQKIGMGVHELNLLKDMLVEDETINAIDKVKVGNKDNTYEISLNIQNFTNWLNDAYITSENKNKINYETTDDEVKLIVELTQDNKYVKNIKTSNNFTIKDISNDNSLDVTIQDVDETTILEPEKFLSKDDKDLTKDQLKKFDEDSAKYWEAHSGSEIK